MTRLTLKFQPRKRKDLNELLDKVASLKTAISVKLELEKQIKFQNKMRMSVSHIILLLRVCYVFLPLIPVLNYLVLKLRLKKSELRMDNAVKEKQSKVYHRNESMLETFFSEVYEEMNERFDYYHELLNDLRRNAETTWDMPYNDVCVMSEKLKVDYPKTNSDKLTAYLSMERILSDCGKYLTEV
jgi:hypothetical protein